MIKYITNPIHSLTQSNTAAKITTMYRNIAASFTGSVKHWKWCKWHRKASAKNSSKLNKLLHNEVNLLIQPIFMLNIYINLRSNLKNPYFIFQSYINLYCYFIPGWTWKQTPLKIITLSCIPQVPNSGTSMYANSCK